MATPGATTESLLVDLGQQKHLPVRIESEGLHEIGFVATRLLPEEALPRGIKRHDARHPGDSGRRIEIAARKRILVPKAVFARPQNKQIAIELAYDTERRIEKPALETELNQHQQHRKPDAGAGPDEPPLVRHQIAPGKRNGAVVRASARKAVNGFLSHAPFPQKISAGSARRSRPSDSNAEMTDISNVAASTPPSSMAVMFTGSSVLLRTTA